MVVCCGFVAGLMVWFPFWVVGCLTRWLCGFAVVMLWCCMLVIMVCVDLIACGLCWILMVVCLTLVGYFVAGVVLSGLGFCCCGCVCWVCLVVVLFAYEVLDCGCFKLVVL